MFESVLVFGFLLLGIIYLAVTWIMLNKGETLKFLITIFFAITSLGLCLFFALRFFQ